jgi:hypothetical protein
MGAFEEVVIGRITFAFHNVYGYFLTVRPEGEEAPEQGCQACVIDWYFTEEGSVPLNARRKGMTTRAQHRDAIERWTRLPR